MRQLLASVIVVLLFGGVLLSAVLGRQLLATALVGLLTMLLFVGLLQVRRRMAQEMRATRAQVARESNSIRSQLTGETETVRDQVSELLDRLQFVQRQLVAAIENERLTGSDRHLELLASLDRVEAALPRPTAATGDGRQVVGDDRSDWSVPHQRHP